MNRITTQPIFRAGPASALLALLVFVERTLLDWRYVAEIVPSSAAVDGFTTGLLYTAFIGFWIWAIAASANRSRVGTYSAIACAALLSVALSVGTATTFCPTPCATVSPYMDIVNWASLVVGIGSIVLLWRDLRTTVTGTWN